MGAVRRTISTGSWRGLSPEVRAGMWATDRAAALAQALDTFHATVGVELVGEAQRQLRTLLASALREAYVAGAEREPDLESALATERVIRLRLERTLREAGLVVPTEERPSEPPKEPQ